MDSDLSIRDISMTFDDDDTVIRSMSDEGDEDEAVLTRLPSHQWKDIIDFLTVEDFKALRLTGSKVSFCMHYYKILFICMHMHRLRFILRLGTHVVLTVFSPMLYNRPYQI